MFIDCINVFDCRLSVCEAAHDFLWCNEGSGAYTQMRRKTHQSLCCTHTQSSDVDEESDQTV